MASSPVQEESCLLINHDGGMTEGFVARFGCRKNEISSLRVCYCIPSGSGVSEGPEVLHESVDNKRQANQSVGFRIRSKE